MKSPEYHVIKSDGKTKPLKVKTLFRATLMCKGVQEGDTILENGVIKARFENPWESYPNVEQVDPPSWVTYY